MNEVGLMGLAGVAVALVLLLEFSFNLIMAPSRIDRDQQAKIQNLQSIKRARPQLQIFYDETKHRIENDGICAFNIGVRILGDTNKLSRIEVFNLKVRVVSIKGVNDEVTQTLQRIRGMYLAPKGSQYWGSTNPETWTITETKVGDEEEFHFVELRRYHDMNDEISVVPMKLLLGDSYEITLRAMAHNVAPQEVTFSVQKTADAFCLEIVDG